MKINIKKVFDLEKVEINTDNLISHFTSIMTLYFVKAYSEKYSDKSFVLNLYLPSIGEIANNSFICHLINLL